MSDKLSAKAEALALAVATGASVKSWASKNKIALRTAYSWAAKPEFKARVSELRAELVREALGRLADTAGDAAAALRKLLKSDSDRVKLGAATAILKTLVELESHAELEERIAQLEKRLHEKP